jgi:hypothetical protein
LTKVTKTQPTLESIRAAAAEEGKWESFWISNRSGAYVTASNIARYALRQIYAPNSLTYALLSVDPSEYFSFDITGFLDWLRRQQAEGGAVASKVSVCGPDVDSKDPRVDDPSKRLPVSSVTNPRSITLSTKNIGPIAIPALKHVVIIEVGDERLPNSAPSSSSTFDGYCDREHEFNGVGAVHIRCLKKLDVGLARWIVLFCDPSDCSTESAAEAVVAVVARDSTIVTNAKDSAVDGQPRGPYLIDVETYN